MSAKKHTHKYYKLPLGNGFVWACGLSDCSHHTPKYLEQTVKGKKSICWNCERDFILESRNMMEDKPLCLDCIPGTTRDIMEFAKKLDAGFSVEELLGIKSESKS
jgi:hypothetical protein